MPGSIQAPHLTEVLKRDYGYRSPDRRRFFHFLPGWPTLSYYARLMTLIGSSSRIANRGEFTPEKWCRDAQLVVRFVESAGGRCFVGGLEEIATHPGPFVFISNHMSMLDTFLLPGMILPFHRLTFVIKESLLHYPVFGAIMRAVEPISVARKNPRDDLKTVLSEGKRFLEEGKSIIVFPQATRSVRFNPEDFNTLGIKLAKNAGVPVVPVALRTDFQKNGKLIREAGPVRKDKPVCIQFGSPIPVEGNGQETHQAVIRFIQDYLRVWGEAIPLALEPPLEG